MVRKFFKKKFKGKFGKYKKKSNYQNKVNKLVPNEDKMFVNTVQHMVRFKGVGFPQRLLTKLRYSSAIERTLPVTGAESASISNIAYNPNGRLFTATPPMYGALINVSGSAQPYTWCTVVGMKVVASVIPVTSGSAPQPLLKLTMYPVPWGAVSLTNPTATTDATQITGAVQCQRLAAFYDNPVQVAMYVSAKKLNGTNYASTDVQFGAGYNNTPAATWGVVILVQDANATGVTISYNLDVQAELYVIFSGNNVNAGTNG